MRILKAVLVISLGVTAGLEAAPARGVYNGWQAQSLHIESFDGTRLAITVHVPTLDGRVTGERLPVIVTQDRSMLPPSADQRMRRFTDQGYVWLSQDRRGTGASFGVQTGFVNQLDARDAKAVIDWAARQPFSSGKTVAMGCSNQGAWQYLVATLRPGSLVAIAPACASPQLFDDAIAINGIPMAALSTKAYAGECNRPAGGARPAGFIPPPARPVDADHDGRLLAAAQEAQRCGAAMLGQYWLNMTRDGYNEFAGYAPGLDDTAMTRWREIRDSGIAILQIGGWYDAAVAGQIEGQRVWGGRLVMGPWVHGNRPGQGSDFPAAERDLDAEMLRFFDRHAKGIDHGADPPGISYYTINAAAGREWSTVPSWPSHPHQKLYLLAPGSLSGSSPGNASGGEERHEPKDVVWFGGRYTPLARWPAAGAAPIGPGSLVHDSGPLQADLEIIGAVRAGIWISADRPDVNVFAMLLDVAPDGGARYITDGRIRASWRKVHPLPWEGGGRTWHRGHAQDLMPLQPGQPELLQFDFFPISYVVKTGHTIRLALATSIGVDYQSPPLAEGNPVTLTIYRDAHHPSAIALPVAPR